MKHADITVMDESGLLVWAGSLYRFARDNEMDRAEVSALISDLRTLNDGRPEPATIGGGASPLFFVSL